MADSETPLGYRWRSSKWYIIVSISIALFSETFLYSFVVPILSYMLEDRLHTDPAYTQHFTSAVLAIHGFVSVIASPIIGHFADHTSSKKTPLLLALIGCLVGTILVACARSLWVLFLGRILQGIAGSAVWIVGLATVADRVGQDHMGKAMGFINSFLTSGAICGPIISGVLLQTAGYWPTWIAPLAVLIFDMIARLIMIERSESPSISSESRTGDDEENRPLVAEAVDTYTTNSCEISEQQDLSTPAAFYGAMLSNGRVLTALITSFASGLVLVSFESTLPLHTRDVFGWGPSKTGMMFLCLEIPSVVVGPIAGWTRDRIGLRYPVALSLLILSPLLWLLGVPGDESFPWASPESRGPLIYIASVFGIGAISPFLSGIANLEMTDVVHEYVAAAPTVFGPHGGFSRAFALSDVAATSAMMLGPIVSGSLHEAVGYYYMNLSFAVIFVTLAVSSAHFLGGRRSVCDQENAPKPAL